jgi:hypothetical protein
MEEFQLGLAVEHGHGEEHAAADVTTSAAVEAANSETTEA